MWGECCGTGPELGLTGWWEQDRAAVWGGMLRKGGVGVWRVFPFDGWAVLK